MSHKIEQLRQVFQKTFGTEPTLLKAPGRINIIGEHIDYNDGMVLPMSIDRSIYMAIGPSGSDQSKVLAMDIEGDMVHFEDPMSVDHRGWRGYVLGVINEFRVRYQRKEGVHIGFTGDIPQGSGLSSSAALEVATAMALSHQLSIDLSDLDMALLCQHVEHKYVGTHCGLMDQYASVFGTKDAVILLDCQTDSHTLIPMNLDPYRFLLLNTGVHHSLAESGYNQRRANCEASLSILQEDHGVESFRTVTEGMIEASRHRMTREMERQSHYVIQEISRVQKAVDAIQSNDLQTLGKLMFESHAGLSLDYQVSCAELDFLVDLARNNPDVLGARMMGGGFGGCSLNLIHNDQVDPMIELARKAYEDKFDLPLVPILVQSGTRSIL